MVNISVGHVLVCVTFWRQPVGRCGAIKLEVVVLQLEDGLLILEEKSMRSGAHNKMPGGCDELVDLRLVVRDVRGV